MPFMRKIAGQIYTLDNEGKTKEAGSVFMDFLKSSEEPGKYQSLLYALKDLDYSILVNAIEHGGVVGEHHEEHKKILDIFMDPLLEKINPGITANILLEKGIISSNDVDKIVKTERYKCSQWACFELLDAIPRKNEKWYHVFLNVLCDLGHSRLCKEIDPKLYELNFESDNPDHLLDVQISSNSEGLTDPQAAQEDIVTSNQLLVTKATDDYVFDLVEGSLLPMTDFYGDTSSVPIEKNTNQCNCSCAQNIDTKIEELKAFFETKVNHLESKLNEQCKLLETLLKK